MTPKVGDVIAMSGVYVVNPITDDTVVIQTQPGTPAVDERGIWISFTDGTRGPFVVSHVDDAHTHLTPEATFNRVRPQRTGEEPV